MIAKESDLDLALQRSFIELEYCAKRREQLTGSYLRSKRIFEQMIARSFGGFILATDEEMDASVVVGQGYYNHEFSELRMNGVVRRARVADVRRLLGGRLFTVSQVVKPATIKQEFTQEDTDDVRLATIDTSVEFFSRRLPIIDLGNPAKMLSGPQSVPVVDSKGNLLNHFQFVD